MKKFKNKVFVFANLSKEIKVNTSKNTVKKFFVSLVITIVSLGSVVAQKSNANIVSNETTMRNFYTSYIEAANNRDFEAIAGMVSEDVLINGKKYPAIITRNENSNDTSINPIVAGSFKYLKLM